MIEDDGSITLEVQDSKLGVTITPQPEPEPAGPGAADPA